MAEKFRWIGRSPCGEQITLKRFRGEFRIADFSEAPVMGDLFENKQNLSHDRSVERRLAVVDVETTGLSWERDAVIEIGLREIFVDAETGLLRRLGRQYQGLADPGRPLPPEITRLTGIRDEDVRGQVIDWGFVNSIIADVDLVVAHNAAFDRPFLEAKVPAARSAVWGCSLAQVDWQAHGFPARKLEVLAIFHGFFVEAHRALEDVDALVHLLSFPSPNTTATYFAELVRRAVQPLVHVIAANSPFESKDLLKQRGYAWNTKERYWHRKLPEGDLDSELAWLKQHVYHGKFSGEVREIPLSRNFSAF